MNPPIPLRDSFTFFFQLFISCIDYKNIEGIFSMKWQFASLRFYFSKFSKINMCSLKWKKKKQSSSLFKLKRVEAQPWSLRCNYQLNKTNLCYSCVFKTYIKYMDALKERRTGAATPLAPPQSRPWLKGKKKLFSMLWSK